MIHFPRTKLNYADMYLSYLNMYMVDKVAWEDWIAYHVYLE